MKCKIGTQCYIDNKGIDLENKTIPVILSDESKVMRYDWEDGIYYIILEHTDDAIDLTRKDILPILIQHDTNMLPLGIYQDVRVEDNKLKATAKFDAEDEKAMEVFGKMSRGFMQTLSVGITIYEKELIEENEKDGNIYKATRWEISEASIVTVPAIPTATVGMSNMGGNTAIPTAISDKLAILKQGVNMEFTLENFNILLESREHLNSNIKTINAQLEDKTSALEAKESELLEATEKLSKADVEHKAYKVMVNARLSEAIATNVDVKTALSMLVASSDNEASKIALESKSNTEALKQGGQAKKDAWADYK